jgi:hypothetical protein
MNKNKRHIGLKMSSVETRTAHIPELVTRTKEYAMWINLVKNKRI